MSDRPQSPRPLLALAAVITYYPDFKLEHRVQKLLSQFEEVLIVDNTPGDRVPDQISVIMNNSNVILLRMEKNVGIAAALNEALGYSISHDFDWMGTFDQDSEVPLNYRERFQEVLMNHSGQDSIAILAPIYSFPDGTVNGFSGKRRNIEGVYPVDLTMTSGNLVRVSIVDKVGGYDSALFIDYVDFDLCLRLRAQGYTILEIKDVVLSHSLGNNLAHRRFLWRKVCVTNHPPLRVYYLVRNRLVLYRRYWKSAPGFVVLDICRLLMVFIKIVSYESERRSKLNAFWKGLKDGIHLLLGPLRPDVTF